MRLDVLIIDSCEKSFCLHRLLRRTPSTPSQMLPKIIDSIEGFCTKMECIATSSSTVVVDLIGCHRVFARLLRASVWAKVSKIRSFKTSAEASTISTSELLRWWWCTFHRYPFPITRALNVLLYLIRRVHTLDGIRIVNWCYLCTCDSHSRSLYLPFVRSCHEFKWKISQIISPGLWWLFILFIRNWFGFAIYSEWGAHPTR